MSSRSRRFSAAFSGRLTAETFRKEGKRKNLGHRRELAFCISEAMERRLLFSTATHLAFTQEPSNALAGIEITPAITVAVEDASDQVVTTDTSTVTMTLTGGPEAGSGSAAAVSGVATFSHVALNDPGTYTLTASDGALTGATSTQFTIGAPGWIDTANMNVISGWAYDPREPDNSASVEIDITGGPTQTFSADQTRSDLETVVGSTNHGFTYTTPVLSVGSHTAFIYVLSENNTKILIGTETLVSQNSLFDEHWYLQKYPNVAAAVADGQIATGYDHYIKYGQFEGYSPSPYWDESWYLKENPDVAAAVKAGTVSSGFMQYYLYGQSENRGGLLYFNTAYYLENNPDVQTAINSGAVTSAFEHFVLYGQYEGRAPMLYFSSTVYDADNANILDFVTGEPLSSDFEHFIEYGQYEGLVASNFYNEATYLADNPDVAAAVHAGEFPDGFQHWLEYGQYEGRTAVAAVEVVAAAAPPEDSGGLGAGAVGIADADAPGADFNIPPGSLNTDWDTGDFNFDGDPTNPLN